MTTLVVTGAGLACFIVGWVSATVTYRVRPSLRTLLSPAIQSEAIADFMTPIVNLEEYEANRKSMHRQLVQSGRRTARLDGGPTAKVSKMRKRKRYSRSLRDQA
jgi:hypothetical protein